MPGHFNYELEDYKYGRHVRKGRQLYMMSEKKIYFGEWLIDKTDPIIIIEMNQQIAKREAPFYREINGHNHIIRTFGSVENPLNLTIYVQEYAGQGDLADCLMDARFKCTQPMLVQMFIQIADAMSYVASNRIVHGDLGCRNVLVFQADTSNPKNTLVKITDFGLARWIEHPPTNEDLTVIPIRYCAPEILRNNIHSSYSEKSDVYSMGALIWEALSDGVHPYSSIEKDNEIIQMKLNNINPLPPQGCNHQLEQLMNNCWRKNPRERPTFDAIKNELMGTRIFEVPHDLITASSHRVRIHYDYELDIHVEMGDLLNDGYPSIYEAEWLDGEEERPIILIETDEEPSVHEKLFYSTFKDHPHIVHTFGFVENDRGSTLILQERAPHGNLQTLLETGRFKPSARVLVEIFSQIIDAMIDIVDQNLVHGDLRCENILVFQMHATDPRRNSVKLSNFTSAHPKDPLPTDVRRSFVQVRYCAPEVLRGAGRFNYSELSDVYSMGVLMWQAYSRGRRPYDSVETDGEVRQRKFKRQELSKPFLCDDQMWAIMTLCCLHNELECRFSFAQLKIQFSKIDFESIEPYKYQLNRNVKQNRPLNGRNGKFYEADWIPKKNPSILLLIIDGPTAEYQASLYMNLSIHPYIIDTLGLVENDQELIMLLQEKALHGNFQTLLQTGKFHPSSKVLVQIFLQIINAMMYISSQNIVHGDLRCANVLVFQMDPSEPNNNLVKLTNFSLARSKNRPVINDRLPESYVRYCAPEILTSDDGSNYSEVSDVYSMGVLMYEACLKGEIPYGRHISDRDVRQRRMEKMQLSQPKDCPNSLWTLIEFCLCNEIDIRVNFEDLQSGLLKIDVTPPRYSHCYSCNKEFPENELDKHQRSCLRPMSPVEQVNVPIRDNRGYISDDDENIPIPPPSKRSRTEAPRTIPLPTQPNFTHPLDNHKKRSSIERNPVVPPKETFRDCVYCNDSYPDYLIDEHRTSHCRQRPDAKSRAVTTNPPRPRRITNENPKINDRKNERITQQPTPIVNRPAEPTVPIYVQCVICDQRIPAHRLNAHEASCKPPARGCLSQFLSCLRFWK